MRKLEIRQSPLVCEGATFTDPDITHPGQQITSSQEEKIRIMKGMLGE